MTKTSPTDEKKKKKMPIRIRIHFPRKKIIKSRTDGKKVKLLDNLSDKTRTKVNDTLRLKKIVIFLFSEIDLNERQIFDGSYEAHVFVSVACIVNTDLVQTTYTAIILSKPQLQALYLMSMLRSRFELIMKVSKLSL